MQSVCRAPGRGPVRTRPLRPGLGTQVGVDPDLAQASTQRLAPAHAGLKSTECLPRARPVLTGKEGRMCAKVSSSEKPLHCLRAARSKGSDECGLRARWPGWG